MDVRLPDGTIVRNVPDGITQADLMARVQAARGGAPTPQKTPIPTPPFEQEAEQLVGTTPAELIAGSAPGRFVLGAASPFLGAGQVVANAVGLGEPVNRHLQELERMKQRGAAAQPSPYQQNTDTGSGVVNTINRGLNEADIAGTAGAAFSAPSLAAMKLAPAASAGGRIAQGAGIGAGFGATTPVTNGGGNFWTDKGAQTGTGLAIGATIPGVVEGARAGGTLIRNVVDPYLPGGVQRVAGRTANAAAGDKRDAVIAALRRNEEIVPGSMPTAGEAAAPVGSAEFAGLEHIVRGRAPTAFDTIAQRQNEARVRALRTVGQDRTALQAAEKTRATNAEANYGAVRGDRVSPQSDVELMEREIADRAASKAAALQDKGRFDTTAAQQETAAHNWYPVPGMPRAPGRYSPNMDRVPEAQAAAAETAGVAATRQAERNFLERTLDLLQDTVGMDNRSLTDLLRRPSMQAAVQDAIKSAAEKGGYFPRKAGEQFSVGNLQRIKESLDAGIKAAKASADAGNRPTLSPEELQGTRDAFVAWLSNRSPGWKDARQAYHMDSLPINRMQVGQYLEGKLTAPIADQGAGVPQRAASYAQALRDAPGTIKRSTGQPRYEELSDVLLPPQTRTVEAVGADLGRSAENVRLGRLGAQQASEVLALSSPKVPAAGMFNPSYSVARAIINRITGRTTNASLDALAKAMQNPQEMARIMEAATPSQRAALVRALSNPTGRALTILGAQGAGDQQ